MSLLMDALKKAEAANHKQHSVAQPLLSTWENTSASSEWLNQDILSTSSEQEVNILSADGFVLDEIELSESARSEEIISFESAMPLDVGDNDFVLDNTELSNTVSSEEMIGFESTTGVDTNDIALLDNFRVEDPAILDDVSHLSDSIAMVDSIKPPNQIDFITVSSREMPVESSKPSVQSTFPPLEPPTPETARRLLQAKQQKRKSYFILFSLLGIGVLGWGSIFFYTRVNYEPITLVRQPLSSPTVTPVTVVNNLPVQPVQPTPPPSTAPAVTHSGSVATEVASTPPASSNPITPVSSSTLSNPTIPINAIPTTSSNTSSSNTSNPKMLALTDVPNKQKADTATGIYNLHKDTQAHQHLNAAYQSLQKGEYSRAEKIYQKVLQQDNRNRDALLGLAAIALQNTNVAQAQHYYQRILQSYPQDNLAQAGLIGTLSEHQPDMGVSQVKILLNQISPKVENLPQIAYLQFILGNLYAQQYAWSEAQQSYFEAFRIQQRADYAYNLAVSLDQLHQYTAATTYYRQALQLAKNEGGSSFKHQAILQRIQELTEVTSSSDVQ